MFMFIFINVKRFYIILIVLMVLIFLFVLILTGCKSPGLTESEETEQEIIISKKGRVEMMEKQIIKLDNMKKYQIIEGFGASGAWWSQDVGNWDNIGEIMDLLYDTEKGIGLNIFRYNIGAGYPNRTGDKWRKSETVEVSPGEYDLSRDSAAIKVFKFAAERGAVNNVVFVNSPPARMTVSGYTSGGDNKKESNLAVEHETDFAKYCVDITKLLLDEGLPVKYLSPINEPQWDWGGKDASQEGCHYKVDQILRVGREIANELTFQKLPVKISLIESGEWKDKTYTLKLYNQLIEDEILRNAMDHFAVHSYWSNEKDKKMAADYFQAIPGMLPLHQTEWCQMESGKDLGMDAALTLAKEVHMDMTILSVASWSHWLAVSKYDYKDGLVYVDTKNKTYTDSKRMWALGNYSRFIKEGYIRIETSLSIKSLSVSAYQSPDAKETVVVLINETRTEPVIGVEAFNNGTTKVYVTDERHICRDVYAELDDVWDYTIPARSVVTFVNSR